METINLTSLMTLYEAIILLGSTSCLAYIITKHETFLNFRIFVDALVKSKKNVARCSLCIGLWVGILNGVALVCSKTMPVIFYKSMIFIDSALTFALLVFIINLIINKLNEHKGNRKTNRRG